MKTNNENSDNGTTVRYMLQWSETEAGLQSPLEIARTEKACGFVHSLTFDRKADAFNAFNEELARTKLRTTDGLDISDEDFRRCACELEIIELSETDGEEEAEVIWNSDNYLVEY